MVRGSPSFERSGAAEKHHLALAVLPGGPKDAVLSAGPPPFVKERLLEVKLRAAAI